MFVSIFNDVIGPVMRGPSSSHCAAALRIGRLARDLMSGQIERVKVEFDKGGSLPTTHTSQGSDMGLFGGLLGWSADDDRLPESASHLREAGIELSIEYGVYGDHHPNTYRLTLSHADTERQLIAISTGGGMMEVIEVDGVQVSIGGDFDETVVWFGTSIQIDTDAVRAMLDVDEVTVIEFDGRSLVQIRGQRLIPTEDLAEALPIDHADRIDRLSAVLPIRSRRDLSVPFESCGEMLAYNEGKDKSLWQLAVDYEVARSGLDEAQIIDRMCEIVSILRRAVEQGLQGTQYEDRVLGFQSGGFRQMMEEGRLIDAGVLNRIVLMTTAIMEVKSSMGVIVAAPTAGACAAFPAVCLAMGEKLVVEDEEIAKSMLAGGLIGVFIAKHWSFAAEVGGCQAEGGSASAMSAAAMVSFYGGSTEQATGAASMALQNMLGLICDPVASRVEVPCLGKNVMAASNAMSSANMALAGFDAVIPLDETISAAREVSRRMPAEHRCTSLGGLAATPTAIGIQKRLEGCASCATGHPASTSSSEKVASPEDAEAASDAGSSNPLDA